MAHSIREPAMLSIAATSLQLLWLHVNYGEVYDGDC